MEHAWEKGYEDGASSYYNNPFEENSFEFLNYDDGYDQGYRAYHPTEELDEEYY